MLLLAAASLTLAFQDPPPGEVISTAPPPAAASTLADPFTPPAPPPRAQSSVDFSAYAETVAERAPASSGTVADIVTPRPAERPRFSLGQLAEGPVWGPSAQPVEPFDRAFANSRASGAPAASATREPLPAEALSDPVRYAAQQCRPEVRPASEGVAECFDRIDSAVREEQDRRAAARRPRTTCSNTQTRDADGRTSTTSGRCTVGTGDPALLDDIFGW